MQIFCKKTDEFKRYFLWYLCVHFWGIAFSGMLFWVSAMFKADFLIVIGDFFNSAYSILFVAKYPYS